MGLLMKRLFAVLALLALGVGCRDAALASGDAHDSQIALCAAGHGIPDVLLAYHHQQIDTPTALARLTHIRHEISENASGRYARHLRDVAAAIHVFEIVTKQRGDTSDAYRDLRALRESLPRCPVRSGVVRPVHSPGATSD
jgi:hypothetical protein